MTRLRGSAPMLTAILAVVAILSGFSIATTVYIDQQGTAGLRSELATRAGADLALRASLALAPNGEQQDAEVRAAIDHTFARTGLTFDVTRSLDAEAYYQVPAGDEPSPNDPAADADQDSELDDSGPALNATYPDLDSRADFVSGTVASGPNEVAVQADAAAKLGLETGDEVLLNEVSFTVSGLWRASDPLDPRWYGDEIVISGGTDRIGPFAITEDAWAQFISPPTAVWTIVPTTLDQFTATNRSFVSAAWGAVDEEWRGNVTGYDSLVVQYRLARTLDEFASRIEGLRAIEPVAAVLVAGSALVVLSQLVQLLVATREHETRLIWSRGQSPGAIARRTAREVAVAAILGASVGVGAVLLGLALTADVDLLVAVRATAVVVPAVVVAGAIVFAGVASYRSALSVTTATKGGRGDARVRRAAIPGVVILLGIAAALAVWQLRLYGSPLTPSVDGSSSIDPVAVVAPAAALVAVVLAALAAFPAVVSFYGKRTHDSGVSAHLSARTLARQTGRVAAPLVIVALAVGSSTVGAAFSATWEQLFDQTADLHAGADVRVSARFDPLTPAEMDAIAATEGVIAVAPLDVQPLSVGLVGGLIVSATPDAVLQLATTAGGTFSREDAAAAIRMDQPGPRLPDGATSLTLRVTATNFVVPPELGLWIAEDLGRLREVPFAEPIVEPGDVLAYTADLTEFPDAVPGTVLSFEVTLPVQSYETEDATFRLEELSAEVAGSEQMLTLDQFWVVDTLRDQLVPPRMNADGDGFAVSRSIPTVRMTATFDGTAIDAMRPGVLVTQRLATLLDLEVGDLIAFNLRDGILQNSYVTGIVAAVPGSRSDIALLADIAVVNHLHLRGDPEPLNMSDAWVTTDDPEQVRERLRPILPANTRITSSDDPVGRQVLGAAAIALWAAAVCCLLIALVAVASASRSRLNWGRNDIASLRALGLSAREQSAVIVREMGVVLAVATVAGLVAGALVSALTVPELARAAVDRAYLSLGTSLSVDWIGLGILLGALAAGVAVILVDLSRRVRVLASTALPSEGHE